MNREGGRQLQRAILEFMTVSRFTIVGIGATAIHIGVVWVLIGKAEMQPLLANLAAFITAFCFSFTGQYLWTFRSNRNWASAMSRFFMVSLGAFFLNNVVLVVLLGLQVLPATWAAIISAFVIPLLTYTFGRLWAFR